MFYQDELREHYKYPYNKKPLDEPASFATENYNPSCGDSISMEGIIENNRVVTLCFQGSGCVISQAAASMLIEESEGKTVEELLALDEKDIRLLVKIELGPVRLKCALLALQALQDGINHYVGKK